MAWEEWERLKTDAAQRTRIDHVADPGGAPDLKASKGPWTKASGVAEELRTATATALTDLTTAHDGAKAPGFTTSDALAEILPTRENRLKAVRDECGRLSTALANFGEIAPAVAAKAGTVDPNRRSRARSGTPRRARPRRRRNGTWPSWDATTSTCTANAA
ncbi:MAG TPA: hypothetical protein VIU15_36750 [Streptomyces sp.]